MSAPIIAVTTWERNIPTALGDARPSYTVGMEYVDIISRAGGVPVLIVPGTDPSALINKFDGIVMTGGEDVHPSHYGATPDPAQEYSASRDAFELALAQLAHERKVPTLGICRGMQVMNTALGGTLIEDIPTTTWHAPVISGEGQLAYRHPVRFTGDSAIAGAYGVTERDTNTIHHQAIANVADGLRITGTAPDGIAEAAESTDAHWLFWGVQWHPEKMTTAEEVRYEDQLFRAFISAVTPR